MIYIESELVNSFSNLDFAKIYWEFILAFAKILWDIPLFRENFLTFVGNGIFSFILFRGGVDKKDIALIFGVIQLFGLVNSLV